MYSVSQIIYEVVLWSVCRASWFIKIVIMNIYLNVLYIYMWLVVFPPNSIIEYSKTASSVKHHNYM